MMRLTMMVDLRRRMTNVAVFLDYRGVPLVSGGLTGGICLGVFASVVSIHFNFLVK